MSRNNTSFPKQNYELLKSIAKDKNDPLRYHQRIVYEYVLKNLWVRGLLIYHKMGAGKSILGTSLCEGLLEQNTDRRVIFMAAKSLHDNFKHSIAKYRKMVAEAAGQSEPEPNKIAEHIAANYQFISLNASNMLTQVHRAVKKDAELEIFNDDVIDEEDAEEFAKLEQFGDLENSIVVIDEAHNLFNSISNGSRNAVGLYRLIMAARDIKVIFLTGSPIVNDPFELAIAMNMIAGPIDRNQTLFGEDYLDFTKYFVGQTEIDREGQRVTQPYIKHKDKFVNRIIGLLTYYGADDAAQKALYPEQLPIIIEKVPMSAKQYASYVTARDREIEEASRSAGFGKAQRKPLAKPSGASSSYRVRSRQISNFYYPEYASRTYKDQKGFLRYEKHIDKLQDTALKYMGSSGRGEDETKFGLEVWSPKMLQLLYNIQRHCPFTFIDSKPSKAKQSKTPDKTQNKAKKGSAENIKIRKMANQDRYEVLELYRKVFGDNPNFSLDDPEIDISVADMSGEIVGIIAVKPGYATIEKKRGDANYLVALAVADKHRRRGIGSKLLAFIHKTYPKVYLKVDRLWSHGEGSRKFYEKHDFYVYRESDSHWFMRRIMGGKDETSTGPIIRAKAGIGAGIIYSQFIDAGVDLIGKVLKEHGFVEITNLDDALRHKKGAAFAIISGQVDPELRTELVKIFNSNENKHGEHLAILLVTSTGAEGLDLKNVRHIHVFEPYWHWARIAQVLARGVRMGSHLALPENQRNVQPYIYLSDYPAASLLKDLENEVGEGIEHIQKQMEKEDTTDVTLYQKSINNQVLINSFLIAAQEASLDCLIHYKDKLECRLCAPTDESLFVLDLDKDIKTPSPCQPLQEKKVKAKGISVTVDMPDGTKSEREFMYTVMPDKEGRDRIHIYENIEELGGYSEIFEDHALFDEVYEAVAKREKIK